MPFDRNTIAPTAQRYYIDIGGGFGSDDTVRQADATLLAIAKYQDVLARHGFGAARALTLDELRQEVRSALAERAAVRAGKKSTNAALLRAIEDGKTARFTIRASLDDARFALFNRGELAAVNDIDAVLATTSSAGPDSAALAEQLGALSKVAAKAAITAALGDQAASLQTLASERIEALHTAKAAKPPPYGTPAETEYLDLLDGMIVELVRMARRAARAASRALGQPVIAKEFELVELYRAKRGASGGEEGNEGGSVEG